MFVDEAKFLSLVMFKRSLLTKIIEKKNTKLKNTPYKVTDVPLFYSKWIWVSFGHDCQINL